MSSKTESMVQKGKRSHYSAPPSEWTTQQCQLFFSIMKQYLQKYNGDEALSRADMCLDRVFRQWARQNGRKHKHRRGYLQQVRVFLRSTVSAEEVRSSSVEQLTGTHCKALQKHLETLPDAAYDTVCNDISASKDNNKEDGLLNAMKNGRKKWNDVRTKALDSLNLATEKRDFAKMKEARDALDRAEQMCLFYGHAAARTKNDVEFRRSSEKLLREEEATFCEPSAQPVEPETGAQPVMLEPGMQLVMLEPGVQPVEPEPSVQTIKEEAEKEKEVVVNVSGPFVAFLHADESLVPAEQYVITALRQYVDPRNPFLHCFAPGVERMAFIEAASLISDSPILATIAALSSGKSTRLFREKLHTMVGDMTCRLKESPFLIVRGINDRRGQVIREQKIGAYNNVCRSAVDNNVLRGIGRAFTAAEHQSPENVITLFCAEPGCFHIAYYDANPQFVTKKKLAHEFAIAVRLHKPHITLTHTVLAPGFYLLDQTIYMPGIDRGRAVAVRSHMLQSSLAAAASASSSSKHSGLRNTNNTGAQQHHQRQQQPAYFTVEYNAERVESLVSQGRWQDAHDLIPEKIFHAGNATLFLAASANDFETLGFIVVGSAGRCMLYAPSISSEPPPLEQQERQQKRSAYRLVDNDTYTQTLYAPAADGHDDALYIDALCGVTSTKTRPARGVGYCLMAHALAYFARSQPTGVLMRIRNGTPPINSAMDASVAFYYYSHFGMQCVSSNVARDVGFLALAEHYKGQKAVSKRQLKQDNMYAHVRNILTTLQQQQQQQQEKQHQQQGEKEEDGEEDYGSENLIEIDSLCGKKPNTSLTYGFVHTLYPFDEKTLSNVLYRQYPHVSELYERITTHMTMLNGGVPLNAARIAEKAEGEAAKQKKPWSITDDSLYELEPAIAAGDENVSESFGGFA